MMSAPFLAVYGTVLVVLGFLSGLRLSRAELYPGLPPAVIVDFDLNGYHPAPCVHLGAKVRRGVTKKTAGDMKKKHLKIVIFIGFDCVNVLSFP